MAAGQRQRLAIARMILTNPSVVILDEATSALDTHTEARLHQAMQGFLDERTTIIIAHRLSAVKQADRVYVFEDGHSDTMIAVNRLHAATLHSHSIKLSDLKAYLLLSECTSHRDCHAIVTHPWYNTVF